MNYMQAQIRKFYNGQAPRQQALGPRYRDRQILDNRTDTAKDERKPEDRDAKKQAPEGH